MTSLDCTIDGEFFVSGSGDKLLKLMHYDDGIPIGIGNNTHPVILLAMPLYSKMSFFRHGFTFLPSLIFLTSSSPPSSCVTPGYGHAGAINALKISPDQKTIVSVGSSGEIIFWEFPPLKQLREAMSY